MKDTQRKTITTTLLAAAMLMPTRMIALPDQLPDPDGKPADMSKPVQVFILMGQSNMLGFGKVSGGDKSVENAIKNKGKYPYLIDEAGKYTVRQDVRNVRVMNFKDYVNEWMTLSGKNIGPELGIGYWAGEVLDAPVLILKSCIGNRSLGWDLLPPGSEPYESGGKMVPGYRGTPDNPKGNGEKVQGQWYAGKQYDDDTDSAKKVLANLGKYYPGATKYEVAGFLFWQGAKDGGNAAHAQMYEKNLVQFIKALRKDFDSPNGLFVCATMGHGKKGSGGNAGAITDAQLAVDGRTGKYPEFKDTVRTFYSNPVSMGGSANGHYGGHGETYMNVGEGMGRLLAELLVLRGEGSSSRPAADEPEDTGSTAANTSGLLRAPRKLAAGKAAELDKALQQALVQSSEDGSLKPVPMPMSFTAAKVILTGAAADGTLSFTANGQKATLAWDRLNAVDRAKLAVFLAKMNPGKPESQALAGAYMEVLGRMLQAQNYYDLAGKDVAAGFDQYFN